MRIGIDLGGTKIEGIALAPDGAERWRKRVPTPAGDYDATLRTIAALVAAAEGATGEAGTVGIATPGAISPATGLLKNSNSVVLNGRPLDRDLEQILVRPVRLDNDATCFAVSEATDGAAAGARAVFGVILGTGVGGGIVVDGRPLSGHNRIAGEWGHVPLPWPRDEERPGPPCYCGKHGCLETFLSGPGLAREFQRVTGRPAVASAIAAAAAAGDTAAKLVLDAHVDRLARGLALVITILDPDVIVLGGGLSNIEALYGALPPLVERYAFSDRITTPIVKNRHGDSSGVRGAAWLWPPAH
ncbi:ROK family Glucokinase with ambiguous substrate specificity [Rhodovulum sp. PH10]|uniref:ROK family protein n=1 Tax=Rhodovulum sp. PH10 TaxID=1187851 RepID=UPI00027C2CDE|nr:ROK family protein [Rhodovulum sp. PH10]EJW11625.1 ROK family Glucokinase with ambiguous substrate specificity [Rhodovulum sp. PH10]